MRRIDLDAWTDRRLAVLLCVLTLLRLGMAALTPVAPDEAYYWTWSQALAPGYLDHPPMVALWIRAGVLLFGKTAFGLRCAGPLATALAAWALWDAARCLFPGTSAGATDAARGAPTTGAVTGSRAGARAVLLLNATLFLGVGSVIMTPDTPLLVFWTLALWTAARIAACDDQDCRRGNGRGRGQQRARGGGETGRAVDGQRAGRGDTQDSGERAGEASSRGGGQERARDGGETARQKPGRLGQRGGRWWLACGAFAGLALDSKYTAALLWFGLAAWVLTVPRLRRWLLRWQPYAGAALGGCLFAPVVVWNAVHGWAGFLKQGGRVADWRPLRAAGFLVELIGSQAGLCTPIIFALCMSGLVACLRRLRRKRTPEWTLLAMLSLPPVLVFLQHATGDRVQGNWPAIVYPALALSAGASAIGQRWINAAALSGLAITGLVYVQVATGILPLPPRIDPIALRLAGWDAAAARIGALAVSQKATFIAAENYSLASELAWRLPGATPVLGMDARWSLMRLPEQAIAGQTGLLVRDARRTDPPDRGVWAAAAPIALVARVNAPGGGIEVFRVTAAPDVARPRLPR